MSDLAERARVLLARGKKIEAVKLVRKELGLSLMEAKQWVERIETFTEAPQEVEPGRDAGPLRDAVRELLRQSRKLDAVKLVRDELSCSLMQAKQWVDDLQQSLVAESLPPGVEQELEQLLRHGEFVEAVARFRRASGVSGSAARKAVRGFAKARGLTPPARGCLATVFLGALGGGLLWALANYA